MGPVGLQELAIIASVALAIFAPYQIPTLGRAAAKAAKEFRSVKESVENTKEELDTEFRKSVEL